MDSIEFPEDLAEKCWFPSKQGDITLRQPISDHKASGDLEADTKGKDRAFFCSEEAEIVENPQGGDSSVKNIRLLQTSSAGGRFLSRSIRFIGKDKSLSHLVPPPFYKQDTFDFRSLPLFDRLESEFAFSPDAVAEFVLEKSKLVDIGENKRDRAILSIENQFDPGANPPTILKSSGVIVVAGSTGTGKSIYAKAIAMRWLLYLANQKLHEILLRIYQNRKEIDRKLIDVDKAGKQIACNIADESRGEFEGPLEQERNRLLKIRDEIQAKELARYVPPNLVTYEDPIEGWKFFDCKKEKDVDLCSHSESDIEYGIRLTPRSSEKDHVLNIKNAYQDALRQKPAIFYIGECRRPKDWETALALGATGHLVVTTCHSSSLVDTFAKLAGDKNRDAESRRILANSLRCVLHLHSAKIEKDNSPALTNLDSQQTLFHLWINSPESVSNFVVDGLSSLISDASNVISRASFARQVLELQKARRNSFDLMPSGGNGERTKFYKQLIQKITKEAARLDRQGE